MRSVVFVGRHTEKINTPKLKQEKIVDDFKCMFCGKQFSKLEKCLCDKAIHFNVLRSSSEADKFVCENALFFIGRTGKNGFHIFNNLHDFEEFNKAKSERRNENLRREKEINDAREEASKAYDLMRKEEEKIEQRFKEKFGEEITLYSILNKLKEAHLKESRHEFQVLSFDEILNYAIKHQYDLIGREISAREYDEYLDE